MANLTQPSIFAPQPATFQPRPYQAEAISAGVKFFQETTPGHALEILPTGSGKSVVIANISSGAEGKTLVLQPSKEILEQNYQKFCSYGYRAGIYSASAGVKHIDRVTFATIGSIASKPHLFRDFKNIIIDECHLVNAEQGQYQEFIKSIEGSKVLGLTATPYRLASNSYGAELRFLTRTRTKIFGRVLYYVQNDVLFNAGYLASLNYYSFNVVDRTMIELNSTGTDFKEASLRAYYRRIDMPTTTAFYAARLLRKRKNLLIFCSLIEEAIKTRHLIDGAVMVTGETPMAERSRILKDFKAGKIRCLVNVGVLTTGFDYPELECILLARSTMSLALYYQMVGRVMRPHTYPDGSKKVGWIVDLGGNINMFGKIETMKIDFDSKGRYCITNNGKQLTNVTFSKT